MSPSFQGPHPSLHFYECLMFYYTCIATIKSLWWLWQHRDPKRGFFWLPHLAEPTQYNISGWNCHKFYRALNIPILKWKLKKTQPPFGGFLKWWYPTTMGFPTKNDQNLGCEMGVPPFKETPIWPVRGDHLMWPQISSPYPPPEFTKM